MWWLAEGNVQITINANTIRYELSTEWWSLACGD